MQSVQHKINHNFCSNFHFPQVRTNIGYEATKKAMQSSRLTLLTALRGSIAHQLIVVLGQFEVFPLQQENRPCLQGGHPVRDTLVWVRH